MLAANQSYSCDTIPPARIAELSSRSPSRSPSPHPSSSTTFDIPAVTAEGEPEEDEARERWGASVQEQEQEASTSTSPPPLQPSQGRKLCIRHQRMADEGMNLQLQKVCSCQYCVGYRSCEPRRSCVSAMSYKHRRLRLSSSAFKVVSIAPAFIASSR